MGLNAAHTKWMLLMKKKNKVDFSNIATLGRQTLYMIDCIKYTVPIIPKITDILINFFNFLYDLSFFIINNIPFQ